VLVTYHLILTVKDLGRSEKQRYDISYKLKEPWQGSLKTINSIMVEINICISNLVNGY